MEHRQPVVTTEAKPTGVRREPVSERARIVEDIADGVRHNLRNGSWILMVVEKIRSDSGRAGHRESSKLDPFSVFKRSPVYPDIRSSALLAVLDREFMAVGRQMADPVQGASGPVGHDTLVGAALPCRHLWSQLQPGGTQLQVVRYGRAYQPIDAEGDTLQNRIRSGQSLQRCPGDLGAFELSSSDETPLFFGGLCDDGQNGCSCHHCIIPR